MQNYTLPAVNQRVDVWFDGYDEYYGGRVESVTHPFKFHVILDDSSAWDIDIRKHIYRLSNVPQDNDNEHDNDNDEGNVQGRENPKKTQVSRRNSRDPNSIKASTTDLDGDTNMVDNNVNTPSRGRRRGASVAARRISPRVGPRTRSRRSTSAPTQVELLSEEPVSEPFGEKANVEKETEVVTLDTLEENMDAPDVAATNEATLTTVGTVEIVREGEEKTGEKEVVVVETVEDMVENPRVDKSEDDHPGGKQAANDSQSNEMSTTNESGNGLNSSPNPDPVANKHLHEMPEVENPSGDKSEIDKSTVDKLGAEAIPAEKMGIENAAVVVSDKMNSEKSVINASAHSNLESVKSAGSNSNVESLDHTKQSEDTTVGKEQADEKSPTAELATDKLAEQVDKTVDGQTSVVEAGQEISDGKEVEKEVSADTEGNEANKDNFQKDKISIEKGSESEKISPKDKTAEVVAIASEISVGMDDPPLPSQDRSGSEMTDTPSQRSREARPDPHPIVPEIPPSTTEGGPERARRRTSGRALRKNTVGPRAREMGAGVANTSPATRSVSTPTRVMTRGGAASLSPKANGVTAADTDGANQRRGNTQPGRAARTRRVSSNDVVSGASPAPVTPPRRGRPPLRKRNLGDRSAEEEEERAAVKRRRMTVDASEPRVAPRRPVGRPRGSVTFRDEVELQTRKGVGSPSVASRACNSEESADKVSASVITAIAVDAALESAKAVVEPLNARLSKLMSELEIVVRELVAQKGEVQTELSNSSPITPAVAGEKTIVLPSAQTPSPAAALNTPVPSPSAPSQTGKQPDSASSPRAVPQTVTIAALENFQLDVSEIIGGGEARLRAHASLSQQEFETLHRIIEHQGKALRELDRLLLAAQAFTNKAKDSEKKTVDTAAAETVTPVATATASDKPVAASQVPSNTS